MMYLRKSTFFSFVCLAPSTLVAGFVPSTQKYGRVASLKLAEESAILTTNDKKLDAAIRSELNYKAGAANTELARRYGYLAGANIKTVGEAFAEFTSILGYTINPLYKGMITDLVGSTHLIVVNARFQRDPIWSLGIIKALELLLKNYPEPEVRLEIEAALFKAVGVNEVDVRADAVKAQEWADSMSRQDIEFALSAKGDSTLATLASSIQNDQFWMYSRYFGIGLLQIMETVGIQMDKDEVYPIMEDWMSTKLSKSHLTACADSDLFFKIREKLDMMETMMKEVEIREKKRMAERLEDKAEQALRAVEREALMQKEIEQEAAKNRERVGA